MAVQDLWEKTKFPSTLKYAEDLDAALERVVQCRRLMCRYGEFPAEGFCGFPCTASLV